MTKLFILVRKRGQKRFIGAFRAKKGATKAQLIKSQKKGLAKGLVARIVTERELLRLALKKRISSPRRRIRKKRR